MTFRNAAPSRCEDSSSTNGETYPLSTRSGGSRMSDRPRRQVGNLAAAFGRAHSGAAIVVRESLNPGWLV